MVGEPTPTTFSRYIINNLKDFLHRLQNCKGEGQCCLSFLCVGLLCVYVHDHVHAMLEEAREDA